MKKMIIYLISLIIIFIYYQIAIKPYNFWSKKNVPTGKITPIFGENLPFILGKESFADMVNGMYKKLTNVRYIGFYQFNSPILLIKSPELIHQICVKDFDYFINHRTVVPEGVDPLLSKNLISIKGTNWKGMRSILSSSFSSNEMKSMFRILSQYSEIFVQYFLNKNENMVNVEFKDASTRYTNDAVIKIIFGMDIDSLNDKENIFYEIGKKGTDLTKFWTKIKFFLFVFGPNLVKLLDLNVLGDDVRNFYLNLVHHAIKEREEKNIKKSDMLGLLIEARNRENTETGIHLLKNNLTDIDITSHIFFFIFGSFENISTTMSFMAHELAINPDVQSKLIKEIDESKDGIPSYEKIMNMTYLNMVVKETLRKWPLNTATDRSVTKPYTIEPLSPNEQPVFLEEGTQLMIPIISIHHDAQYYENPDKFDPERFSLENKEKLNHFAYLPFGVGPRNCVAYRFVIMKIKIFFFHLLRHFEIVTTEKTQLPLKLNKKSLNLMAEGGFHLGLRKRI